MKPADETLYTCPDCGQPNFTKRGLGAHRGRKACTERQKERAEPAKKLFGVAYTYKGQTYSTVWESDTLEHARADFAAKNPTIKKFTILDEDGIKKVCGPAAGENAAEYALRLEDAAHADMVPDTPAPINGICDGCGKESIGLTVINRAPVANFCLCQVCMQAPAVPAKAHGAAFQAGAAAPLPTGAGDLTADLFNGGDTPLFNQRWAKGGAQ